MHPIWEVLPCLVLFFGWGSQLVCPLLGLHPFWSVPSSHQSIGQLYTSPLPWFWDPVSIPLPPSFPALFFLISYFQDSALRSTGLPSWLLLVLMPLGVSHCTSHCSGASQVGWFWVWPVLAFAFLKVGCAIACQSVMFFFTSPAGWFMFLTSSFCQPSVPRGSASVGGHWIHFV